MVVAPVPARLPGMMPGAERLAMSPVPGRVTPSAGERGLEPLRVMECASERGQRAEAQPLERGRRLSETQLVVELANDVGERQRVLRRATLRGLEAMTSSRTVFRA